MNQHFVITYSVSIKISLNPSQMQPSFIYILDKLYVYSDAVATFHAPHDLCGMGMCHEHIHAVSSGRHSRPNKTVFLSMLMNLSKIYMD